LTFLFCRKIYISVEELLKHQSIVEKWYYRATWKCAVARLAGGGTL